MPVDDPHSGGEWVDAEAGPSQIEKRQGRQHVDCDLSAGRLDQKQLDRPLGDGRRSRYGVEHVPVLDGRVAEAIDDVAIHVVDSRRAVIDRVERGRRADDAGGGVASGAQKSRSRRHGLDGVARALGDQVGAGGTEADNRHPGRGHGWPGAGTCSVTPPAAPGSVVVGAGGGTMPGDCPFLVKVP